MRFGSRNRGGLLGHSNGHWLQGGLGLGLLGVKAANLQLPLVLLQDTLIVVLPKLLRGVLAGNSLQDLLATCRRGTLETGVRMAKMQQCCG